MEALQIAARGFGEESYGLVGVRHPANALVMIEVETLKRPEDVIRATHLFDRACVIKPVAGSFVEAQCASKGTTRRKRSITSPSASPSSRLRSRASSLRRRSAPQERRPSAS